MYLISYDIQDNRLRLKAAKLLLQHGLYRLQYSVFMGTVGDTAIRRLQISLDSLGTDPAWTESDTLLILPLHQYSRDNLYFMGKLPEDWDLIQRKIHTLIL